MMSAMDIYHLTSSASSTSGLCKNLGLGLKYEGVIDSETFRLGGNHYENGQPIAVDSALV
jgi:hypothetical protein